MADTGYQLAPIGAKMITGNKLKAIRCIRGMTQAELAAHAGSTQGCITEYETGKKDMRASTILKLMDALGVKVTYHVGDTDISGP